MNTEIIKTEAIEKACSDGNFDIAALMKKSRHKAELPLIVIAVFLNFVILFSAAYYFKLLHDGNGIITDVASWWLTLSSEEIDFLANSEAFFIPAFFILLIIKILFDIKKLYHSGYANGVRVSDAQFPEIYSMEKTFGKLMNFKKTPKVFINSDSEESNIMGVTIHSKTFLNISPGVAIYTPSLSQFIIAREYAHVYYGHRSLLFYLLTFSSHAIPIFGKLLRRCTEYSADRVAQTLLGDEMALDCLVKSCVHYLTVRELNVDEYLKIMRSPCGKEASLYYLWLNMNASMPINRYRIQAMLDPEKKDGRLL